MEAEWSELGGILMRSGAATTVGKVRRHNEDSLLNVVGAYVVADGMGGHQAGDVASALTIDAVAAMVGDGVPRITAITAMIGDANTSVRRYAETTGQLGMGTTLVGAFVVQNADDYSVVIANVGDSRCYSLRDGVLRQVTTDHSHVQELVTAGSLTAEEARHHRDRNIVTRAVGVDPVVAADYSITDPTSRERLMLCSDGVSGELDEDRLRQLLTDNADPQAAADAVIEAVMEGRAADNATLIVVDFEGVAVPPPEPQSYVEDITQPTRRSVPADSSFAPPSAPTSELPPPVLPAPLLPAPVLPVAADDVPSAPLVAAPVIDQVPGFVAEGGAAPTVEVGLIREVMDGE
jgi:serine/threonine protein phosphatase PrpC